MLIPIEKERESENIPEWGLLEFQGSFSLCGSAGSSSCKEYIGDLNYTKDGIPFFVNGHHILYGQEVKLQKPFAVIAKNFKSDDYTKQYLIKAVIRKKIIFKSRPKPIIPHEIPINNL